MELTRTDAVFSRIAMVLFLCRNISSRNDLKLHGEYIWNIYKILAKESTSGGPHPVHEGGGTPSILVAPLDLHRPQLQLHIFTLGEKKIREKDIAFYDTEPPPSPVLPREGRSGVRLRLQRGESVAIVIINHPSSPIS